MASRVRAGGPAPGPGDPKARRRRERRREPLDRRDLSLLLDEVLLDARKRYDRASTDAARRSWAKQVAGLSRVRRDLLRDHTEEELERRIKVLEELARAGGVILRR